MAGSALNNVASQAGNNLNYNSGQQSYSSSATGSGVYTTSTALDTSSGSPRSSSMINKQSNNAPIPVLYGKQRLGGTRVFVASSNGTGTPQSLTPEGEWANTEFLNVVITISEGEMGQIQELYFNETVVWDSNAGGTFASRAANKGEELLNFIAPWDSISGMRMFYYNGTTTQDRCDELTASINTWNNGTPDPGDVPTLSGIAYIVAKLPVDEVFGGNLPTMTVVTEGKDILDVSGMTAGTAPYTTTVSGEDQNPVDVMYDYLTSDKFGKGLDRDYAEVNGVITSTRNRGRDIDLPSFKQARIHCDAARGGLGYPFNGFLPTGNRLFDNVQMILDMCNGMLLFIDGKYHMRIRRKDEQLSIPAYGVFTTADIMSSIALTLPSKTSKLNKAIGVYGSEESSWNDDLVVYAPFSYLEQDGLTVLEHKQEYSLITDKQFVTDLIQQKVDYSRDSEVITFTTSHRALELRAGEVIEVQNPDYGWGTGAGETRRYWRVIEITINEDNTVDISAAAYDSGLEL